MKVILFPVVILIWALSAQAAPADSGPTLDEQVKHLLDALNHYQSRAGHAQKSYPIVIVHHPSVPEHTVAGIKTAFEANRAIPVRGVTFTVEAIPFTTTQELHQQLTRREAAAVFLTEGNEKCVREITATTRAMKILSMTNVSDYVHWMGVTLGVEVEEGELKIMVNLSSCQHEKIDFDEHVLGQASVYF